MTCIRQVSNVYKRPSSFSTACTTTSRTIYHAMLRDVMRSGYDTEREVSRDSFKNAALENGSGILADTASDMICIEKKKLVYMPVGMVAPKQAMTKDLVKKLNDIMLASKVHVEEFQVKVGDETFEAYDVYQTIRLFDNCSERTACNRWNGNKDLKTEPLKDDLVGMWGLIGSKLFFLTVVEKHRDAKCCVTVFCCCC
jgi:hypothetical protein